MRRCKSFLLAAFTVCTITVPALGQIKGEAEGGLTGLESPSRAIIPGPASLDDAAFDIYVNPHHIGHAWYSADAALMTDVALQLAEGERILVRSRKGLSAKEAFEVAVRVATERQDKVALERIAKYAALAKNSELAASAAAAQKLASVSRDTTYRMLVDPEKIELKHYGLMHDCIGQIRMAKIAGNVRSLDLIEQKYLPYFPELYKEEMTKCLGAARHEIEGTTPLPPELTERLKRLALISRDDDDENAQADPPVEVSGAY